MSQHRRQISILGLLGLVSVAAVVAALMRVVDSEWIWGLQAIILTPLLLMYAFSWTMLLLLAPALVAVFPGVSPAAPTLRWLLAVIVGAAECLFVMLWMETDSVLGLLLFGVVFAVIWLLASVALREYSELS